MDRPVLISFCATFLKKEMLHVYRQISGIDQFDHWVATRRRENGDLFPYPQVQVLRRSPWRLFQRSWYRMQGLRVPMSRYESRQLLDLAEKRRAALIHVYFGSEAARVLGYLRRETRPKIVSFHGADVSTDVTDAELQAIFSAVDLVLCRSRSLADVLTTRGCPPERIRLNPTGVPVASALPQRDAPAREAARALRCLQACRFIAKKGVQVSVKAVAILRDAGWRVQLTLVGDGPERSEIESLVQRLDLQACVAFPGFLTNEEVLALMREHDVFLHPSLTTERGDQEGIPNALLEAMGQGLPVVATRHGGIPEAIEDGVHGLLVDSADERSLARAVDRLATDPQLYEGIRERGYERVKQYYSLASCLSKLQQHYREAVALGRDRVCVNR